MDSVFLAEFRNTLESASERLLKIPEAETEAPGADGWNAKQVLGHLIDSAVNNHIRFVRAQDFLVRDYSSHLQMHLNQLFQAVRTS